VAEVGRGREKAVDVKHRDEKNDSFLNALSIPQTVEYES
jgi:hypothetical protein